MNRLYILTILICTTFTCTAKDFSIHTGQTIRLSVPKDAKPVVGSALEMFKEDVTIVFGAETNVVSTQKAPKADIILYTDRALPWEGFSLSVHDGILYIKGADDHGLAYGLLQLSRLIGVSPWLYWADCMPEHKDIFSLKDGYKDEQHPTVKYRGIFINDEDWGMNPWATHNEPDAWTLKAGRVKGAVGPKTNEKIFQLLLRLRANYYWPAMHECSQPFFTIKGNREMAKKYGIYIGGSHCEPMATSPAVEWAVRGHGDYNYVTNRDSIFAFWRERVNDVKDQEIVYTLGMRGVHDGAMQGVKTKEDKLKYLQQVIDDQRQMLKDVLDYDEEELKKVPQVFVPYKEVLDTYHNGLRVPDDVTLMWTDDNYGYIRHFPDSTELKRTGGNGLYYHLSYWGRPHDYLWLNSMPPQIMVPQLVEALERGIRGIWIANVGDLKPGEYQTELFMDLAWNGKIGSNMYGNFFYREFGDLCNDIIPVMNKYFELMYECKPEFLAGTRTEEQDKAYWNTIHPANDDWTQADVAQRVNKYKAISDEVERISALVPTEKKDAFFELVKYPVQCAAQMNFKFLCPDICEEAYDSIQSLTYIYNKVCAGGKWDGIMSCAPRDLPVFKKVKAGELPTYPINNNREELSGIDIDGNGYYFETNTTTDSLTLEVRVFPHHPITGDRISFTISVDNNAPLSIDYQTYDRNEEWKQNVLRGYAKRIVILPVDKTKSKHTIHINTEQAQQHIFFADTMPRIFLLKNLAE